MPFSEIIPNKAVLNDFRNTEIETGFDDKTKLWEVIVKFNGDIEKLSETLQIEYEILSENFAILTLSLEKIPLLKQYTEIEHIELPKILTTNFKENLQNTCVLGVQKEETYNLSGEGVIIAILDSGIDYKHPDFINNDGTSRIAYLWDQTVNGNPPEGFNGGTEYNNSQINEAINSEDPFKIVPEIDTVGHGTAVAGIAAGNGRASGGGNLGIAPKSTLIVVKLGERGYPSFAKTTEFMRAIRYVMTKSQGMKMPLVINISYGTNDGPHNGESLFEMYINDMAEKWKTSIVVACGNEGDARHHYSGKILSNQTQEILFFYSGVRDSFYITLWKNFVDDFNVELILPNGRSTGIVNIYNQSKNYRIDNVAILVNYIQPKFYSTFQEIFFQINSITGTLPVGIYKIKLNSESIIDGNYNIYLPTVEEVGYDTAFTDPSNETTLTIPSTAKNVISVAGYDSTRNIISGFSGRGFTINVVYTKPDLSAPSVNIISTSLNGGYSTFTGTSIAAPFVSGAAALIMQWGIVKGNDPFMYGERVKSYLLRGCKRDRLINYPNKNWGYGELCVSNTLRELAIFNLNLFR